MMSRTSQISKGRRLGRGMKEDGLDNIQTSTTPPTQSASPSHPPLPLSQGCLWLCRDRGCQKEGGCSKKTVIPQFDSPLTN